MHCTCAPCSSSCLTRVDEVLLTSARASSCRRNRAVVALTILSYHVCIQHGNVIRACLVQVSNPGSISTMMRTAAKLQPFDFNGAEFVPAPPRAASVPWIEPASERARAAAAREMHQHRAALPVTTEMLCAVCRDPLAPNSEAAVSACSLCAPCTQLRAQGACKEDGESDGPVQRAIGALERSRRTLDGGASAEGTGPDKTGAPAAYQAGLCAQTRQLLNEK